MSIDDVLKYFGDIIGFCGDGFDQGGFNVAGNLNMDDDGHFILAGTGPDALSNPGAFVPRCG